jgi:hypothetical protein
MANNHRKRRLDPTAWALWAEQRRNELPLGIPPDFYYDVCKRIVLVGLWGCEGHAHSVAATRSFIRETDFDGREAEVLAWLESIGGRCDCSIQTKAYRRLIRLFRTWEEWAPGE